jgi:hypothetical protein
LAKANWPDVFQDWGDWGPMCSKIEGTGSLCSPFDSDTNYDDFGVICHNERQGVWEKLTIHLCNYRSQSCG